MSKQLHEQIKQWSEKNNFLQQYRKSDKKRKEELSNVDLEELMGISRPTYRRKRGGAYRQK